MNCQLNVMHKLQHQITFRFDELRRFSISNAQFPSFAFQRPRTSAKLINHGLGLKTFRASGEQIAPTNENYPMNENQAI